MRKPELLDLKGRADDPVVDRAGSRLVFARVTSQSDIWRWERGGQPSVFLRTNLTDGNPQYSAEGGEERQVLKDAVPARSFAVVPDGIYYISPAKPDLADRGAFLVIGNRRAPESWKHCEIRFYPFRTGRSVVLGEIGGPVSLGLTVSPDRKTFLYTRSTDEADLFMTEGFR